MDYTYLPKIVAFLGIFALAACSGTPPDAQGWDNGKPGNDPATNGSSGDPSGDQANAGVVQSGQDDGGAPAPTKSDAGSDAAPSNDDAGSTHPVISCTSPNACEGARDVGEIAGDATTGVVPLRVSGTTSEWLKVRVDETSSSVTGAAMGVKATLTPTSSASYALSLYVDPNNDVLVCDAPTPTSTASDPVQSVVSSTWGEGRFGNDSDDSRWVTLHVETLSGTCESDTPWTLLIEGGVP